MGYRRNNEIYPSVTEIIKRVSQFKDSKPGPAAHIGTLLHYHILKQYRELPAPILQIWGVDEQEVFNRLSNGLQMWRKLNLNFKPIYVEEIFYDDHFKFAGKVDLLAEIDDDIVVIDLKTGDYYEEYLLQMAAYSHLTSSDYAMIIELDLDTQRNPNSEPSIKYFCKDELNSAFRRFLEILEDYRKNLNTRQR